MPESENAAAIPCGTKKILSKWIIYGPIGVEITAAI